jgi:SAM-dependent methyltransferase
MLPINSESLPALRPGKCARRATLADHASADALVKYYDGKTQAILDRYGPGPRVHYHTGLMDGPPSPGLRPEQYREQLVASQEWMLRYASQAWRLRTIPFSEVLDVGCGLGGGAIWLAQEFGALVTGVTIAATHVSMINRFAAEAGVSSLVRPLVCDALTVPGENCFDMALAIDSSSSFDRRPWFHRLHKLLRAAGRVFIFDCFLGRPEYEEPFNRHWCARIGSVGEYARAAREAGFRLEAFEDVSRQARHFWSTTIALIRAEARDARPGCSEGRTLEESLSIHDLVRKGLDDGGLTHMLLSFRKA